MNYEEYEYNPLRFWSMLALLHHIIAADVSLHIYTVNSAAFHRLDSNLVTGNSTEFTAQMKLICGEVHYYVCWKRCVLEAVII